MRLGLQAAGVPGSRIVQVEFPRCRYRPISVWPTRRWIVQRLSGTTIERIDRLGKALVFVTAPGLLVIEPRMTGLVLVRAPQNKRSLGRDGARLPDRAPQYIRLRLYLENAKTDAVHFWDRRGLGRVYLFSSQQWNHFRSRRGQDALKISCPELQRLLAPLRRPLKTALMDQTLVSGIGNLYASEILHQAAINPWAPCCALDQQQWRRLHRAVRDVLREAIRNDGSTLSDLTYRTVLGELGRYQTQHRVYQRDGKPCPTCGSAIVQRARLAQRSTFYCPNCQAHPRNESL